jgi:hypothetical protein
MGESLMQQRRVSEEGPWVVKLFRLERRVWGVTALNLTVPKEEALANSVPAAAVIRKVQALFGMTGRKERVDGFVCRM